MKQLTLRVKLLGNNVTETPLKSEGFRKVKDSEKRRVQGAKDSRGQVEKDRRLEGWKVGCLAKNQKGEEKTLQIRETQRRAEGGDRGQRSEDRGQEMIVIHSN